MSNIKIYRTKEDIIAAMQAGIIFERYASSFSGSTVALSDKNSQDIAYVLPYEELIQQGIIVEKETSPQMNYCGALKKYEGTLKTTQS